MKPQIALFDFDGTITSKDTFIEFAMHAVGKLNFIYAIFLNIFYLVGWKLSLVPNSIVKQKLFSTLFKGMEIGQFNDACNSFSNKIDDFLHPIGYYKLKMHIDNKCKVYIVSASIDNWIKPWALKHGITNVIATKIEVDKNGIITGRFLSKNCFGKEKISRIKENIPDLSEYDTFAYGDSKSDLPMIKLANHGILL